MKPNKDLLGAMKKCVETLDKEIKEKTKLRDNLKDNLDNSFKFAIIFGRFMKSKYKQSKEK